MRVAERERVRENIEHCVYGVECGLSVTGCWGGMGQTGMVERLSVTGC
jgi:hypothetical protein